MTNHTEVPMPKSTLRRIRQFEHRAERHLAAVHTGQPFQKAVVLDGLDLYLELGRCRRLEEALVRLCDGLVLRVASGFAHPGTDLFAEMTAAGRAGALTACRTFAPEDGNLEAMWTHWLSLSIRRSVLESFKAVAYPGVSGPAFRNRGVVAAARQNLVEAGNERPQAAEIAAEGDVPVTHVEQLVGLASTTRLGAFADDDGDRSEALLAHACHRGADDESNLAAVAEVVAEVDPSGLLLLVASG
ncbi:MAG: hypothetical protein GY882_13385, partial [Actinomycetia bacterium]|nr:hypothetical protein [Actinomycetes bacterium]